MAKFNVFTAGLPQMGIGLALLGATGVLWMMTGRVWIWLGVVGFVVLCWGLLGGARKDDGF